MKSETANQIKDGATARPWHVGEKQPDFDSEGNGYCWPVCALTKEQREKSNPKTNYLQNPAYCNSAANAALIAQAVNERDALLAVVTKCEHVIGMAQLKGKLSDHALSPEWDALRAARACLDKAREAVQS